MAMTNATMAIGHKPCSKTLSTTPPKQYHMAPGTFTYATAIGAFQKECTTFVIHASCRQNTLSYGKCPKHFC